MSRCQGFEHIKDVYILLLCSYVYHVHPLITSLAEMGMYCPVGFIKSSTGKGLSDWTLVVTSELRQAGVANV